MVKQTKQTETPKSTTRAGKYSNLTQAERKKLEYTSIGKGMMEKTNYETGKSYLVPMKDDSGQEYRVPHFGGESGKLIRKITTPRTTSFAKPTGLEATIKKENPTVIFEMVVVPGIASRDEYHKQNHYALRKRTIKPDGKTAYQSISLPMKADNIQQVVDLLNEFVVGLGGK